MDAATLPRTPRNDADLRYILLHWDCIPQRKRRKLLQISEVLIFMGRMSRGAWRRLLVVVLGLLLVSSLYLALLNNQTGVAVSAALALGLLIALAILSL